MRVLVTGSSGFVGSHLVESQLAHGVRVRAVDLLAPGLAHESGHGGLQAVVGDIRDRSLVEGLVNGIDVVYHLAAAHLDVSQPDEIYWQVNVEATGHLLRAAHRAGVRRFVHCSSNGVLGRLERIPADETAPCRPTNVYEETKLAGERAALSYAAETGFPVVVARPAWVYGPGCPRTARLMRMVSKGRFLMFGDGRTLRHPIYVDDAVRGLELCAAVEQAAGQVYFLAGPQAVTIEALVQAMAAVQGIRLRVMHLPTGLGVAGGQVLQLAFGLLGRRPPFSRRSMDFFLKDNAYDTGKARRDLGFGAQVELEEGLSRTWRSMHDGRAGI